MGIYFSLSLVHEIKRHIANTIPLNNYPYAAIYVMEKAWRLCGTRGDVDIIGLSERWDPASDWYLFGWREQSGTIFCDLYLCELVPEQQVLYRIRAASDGEFIALLPRVVLAVARAENRYSKQKLTAIPTTNPKTAS